MRWQLIRVNSDISFWMFICVKSIRFMRQDQKDENFNPMFRNTRSRLYQRKRSSEDQERSHSREMPTHTGQHWKQQGNHAFKQHQYDTAIECYSKAITINPGESQFYSNRSKCFQKKGELDSSLKDAETACELDEDNIKAHYICGCILAELGKGDDSKLSKAENRLRKALRLCRTKQTREYEQEISIKMFRLKKLIWLKNKEKELIDLYQQQRIMARAAEDNQISRVHYERISSRLKQQEEGMRRALEIPDHLICKITLQLMEEPVVSEDGFTYEKKVLDEHFRLKGPVEPITRRKVEGKLFPNHALKQATEEFLRQNPWAFEEEKGEDFKLIPFI